MRKVAKSPQATAAAMYQPGAIGLPVHSMSLRINGWAVPPKIEMAQA